MSGHSRSPGTNLRKSAQSVDKENVRRLRPASRRGHHENRQAMRFGTLICVPKGPVEPKNPVVSRGIFVEKAYFVRETGPFSRARRWFFPVFVIWKHSLILGLSKSEMCGLMGIGNYQGLTAKGRSSDDRPLYIESIEVTWSDWSSRGAGCEAKRPPKVS